MRRLLLMVCVLWLHGLLAQKRCVVADIESHKPLRGVKVYTDANYTAETDYTGNFLLPAGFKVLTLTGFGYMRRIVHPTEVADTLFLLPTMLNEVVILGEAPKPGFDLSRSIRQSTAGIPKKTAPVTFDFFSIFDKSKRTPSKKERMMTKKILETY